MTTLTTDDPVFVLHRYYLQASLTRKLFEQMMERYPPPLVFGSEGFINILTSMGLWYGALYAVVEGWRDDVKPNDPDVDPLIADPKTDKLRRFRNAVFHYQIDYYSPKMMEAMQDPDFVPWVTLLHKEIGRYFLEYIRKHRV